MNLYEKINSVKADATINGRKMWRAETVAAWCDVTDDNLGEYVKACRA